MKLSFLGLVAFLSVLVITGQVRAQDEDYNDGIKDELNQEIDGLNPKKSQAPLKHENAPAPQVRQQNQPIYILQQPAPVQAQSQPTTNIEATPVGNSKAEQLRKQREEVERQNDEKLVERLEDDRLNQEKDRPDKIFIPTPSKSAMTPNENPAPAQTIITPAPVVAAPQTRQTQPVYSEDDEMVPVTRASTRDEFQKEEEGPKFEVGALAGIGSYPTAQNITGSYAAGVSVDMMFTKHMGVELDGLFSQYNWTNPVPNSLFLPIGNAFIVSVNQINILGGFDYRILESQVSPVLGVLTGYTRRNYSNLVGYGYQAPPPSGSTAFDGGFKVGIDVKATKSLTVGADIRYMLNLSYRTDDPLAYYYYGSFGSTPLESVNYLLATISLKLAL